MNNTSIKTLIVFLSLSLSFSQANAQIATSFSKAKSNLYKKVEGNSGLTFYTNCSWSKKKVDLESCGLQNSFPTKHLKRAKRTEAEHIIPASWMYKKHGKYRECYTKAKVLGETPRKYCQANDIDYRNAHNDLMNLVPAVGQLNALRSNKPFAEKVSGKKEQTFRGNGKVFLITSRVAIPDKSIRGDIARVAFYMGETYGVTYSRRQLELFKKWDKEDLVSQNEINRKQRIFKIQGIK
jgi:deoxyribonuclease-1